MKKILYILMAMMLFLTSSYADNQESLIYWGFEEGVGSITIDSSEYGHLGVMANGANFQTGSAPAFGSYGVDFDGGNDVVQTTLMPSLPSNISFSIWSRPDNNDDENILEIYTSSGRTLLRFEYDSNSDKEIEYSLSDNSTNLVDIDVSNLANQVYRNHIVTISSDNNTLTYYRDAVKISQTTYPDIDFSTDESVFIRLGTDQNLNFDYDGDLDEFRLISGILNQSQVSDIYNNNQVTLRFLEEDAGGGNGGGSANHTTQEKMIITSFTPSQGELHVNPVDFSITLNEQASCDLYVDNSLEASFIDRTAFTETIDSFESGTHEFFWYCDQEDEDQQINYFELSNVTQFDITAGDPNEITFFLSGNDFDVSQDNFYITTPCLDQGIRLVGTDNLGYDLEANPGGAHFVQFQDGQASITLTPEDHEFCLFNGWLVYDTETNNTVNYEVLEFNKQVNLGTIDVPSDINAEYVIGLDALESYQTYDPKAWNTSWQEIIGGLILLILGGLVLIAGVSTNNGKIVIAGTLLCITALGIEIGGILGIIL